MEDWNMKQVYDCLPKNRKNKGFTLTEILVTVAILVILMSLATVSFVALRRNLRQKELDAKAAQPPPRWRPPRPGAGSAGG